MKTHEGAGGSDLDQGWTDSPFVEDGPYAQEENPMLGEMPEHPIHVKVVDTQSQDVAAEFTAWSTQYPVIAGQGVATQLCPHRYHRDKAKFRWYIPPGITVWIANKPDPLSSPTPANSQYQLTSYNGGQPDYDGQQPMYAVYTGTATEPTSPTFPNSGSAIQNTNNYPVTVVLAANGATISAVTVSGQLVGGGPGTYIIPAGGSISVSYTVATPTWVWTNANLAGQSLTPWVAIMDESYGTVQ